MTLEQSGERNRRGNKLSVFYKYDPNINLILNFSSISKPGGNKIYCPSVVREKYPRNNGLYGRSGLMKAKAGLSDRPVTSSPEEKSRSAGNPRAH